MRALIPFTPEDTEAGEGSHLPKTQDTAVRATNVPWRLSVGAWALRLSPDLNAPSLHWAGSAAAKDWGRQ